MSKREAFIKHCLKIQQENNYIERSNIKYNFRNRSLLERKFIFKCSTQQFKQNNIRKQRNVELRAFNKELEVINAEEKLKESVTEKEYFILNKWRVMQAMNQHSECDLTNVNAHSLLKLYENVTFIEPDRKKSLNQLIRELDEIDETTTLSFGK